MYLTKNCFYIRTRHIINPCDAVDNLASIAAKRGQAPEEAYAQLDKLLGPSAEEVVRGSR